MQQPVYLPDVSGLEIPMDAWTQPFWDAAAQHRLMLPSCGDCGHFRWPPGPFCPQCQSQNTSWHPAGQGRVYSFTVVREPTGEGETGTYVPALIEFPEAGGIRLLAAIAGSAMECVHIGAAVSTEWTQSANATVPYFVISPT